MMQKGVRVSIHILVNKNRFRLVCGFNSFFDDLRSVSCAETENHRSSRKCNNSYHHADGDQSNAPRREAIRPTAPCFRGVTRWWCTGGRADVMFAQNVRVGVAVRRAAFATCSAGRGTAVLAQSTVDDTPTHLRYVVLVIGTASHTLGVFLNRTIGDFPFVCSANAASLTTLGFRIEKLGTFDTRRTHCVVQLRTGLNFQLFQRATISTCLAALTFCVQVLPTAATWSRIVHDTSIHITYGVRHEFLYLNIG
jgi:hypothetical protein